MESIYHRLGEQNLRVMVDNFYHYVMEDDSIMSYKMAYKGEFNNVDEQQTIRWDSDKFNMEWPCTSPILSKRDKNAKKL